MLFNRLILKYRRRKNPIWYWKSKGMEIGSQCEIAATSDFGSEPYLIQIGNHVRVNDGVRFVTHDGGMWVLRHMNEEWLNADVFGLIKVKDNVHIGTNVIVMPGVTIGENVVIGCGAIVTKDIPDNTVAVGIPAKVIETIDDYRKKHENGFDKTKDLNDEKKKEYLKRKFILD